MVRPTKFDKKYSLVRETTSKTSTGGTALAVASVLYEDWCNKKPVTGKKRMDFTSLNYTNPYELTVRKRTDFTIVDTDLIRLDSVDYQIKSLYESEDEMYLIMDVAK